MTRYSWSITYLKRENFKSEPVLFRFRSFWSVGHLLTLSFAQLLGNLVHLTTHGNQRSEVRPSQGPHPSRDCKRKRKKYFFLLHYRKKESPFATLN